MKLKQKLSSAITAVFIIGFSFFVYAEQPFDKSVFNDSDQDGLSDEEEKMYGTDLFNRDTDGDGYSDGAEIKGGYDPLKPAPGDKLINTVVENKKDITNTDSSFDAEVIAFLKQKGEKNISLEDLEIFVTENIENKIKSADENSVLTEEEIKNIKVKKQDYQNLDEAERKEKEKEDAVEYLAQMIEVLVRNAPMNIVTEDDMAVASQVFFEKFNGLSSDNPDYEYFRDFGGKLVLAKEQMAFIEVPETFLDIHINFLSIVKNFIGLRDLPVPMEDDTGKLIIISRAVTIAQFFATDFMESFLEKIKTLN